MVLGMIASILRQSKTSLCKEERCSVDARDIVHNL